MRPYWKKFFIAVGFSVPVSLCSAGVAYLVKPALDDVFLKKDMQMLIYIPLAILALYAIKGVFEYGLNYFLGAIGQFITNDIRNKLYRHLQTLSLSFFHKNQTGAVIARVTNDVTVLSGALNEGVIDIFKSIVSSIGLITVLFKIDHKMASIAFLILPWMLLPIAVTEAKITIEISPAMRPYSIAVTPDSSLTKRTSNFFIWLSLDVT